MTGSKKTYLFSDTSLSLRISHFLDVATLFEDLSSLGRGWGEGGAPGGGANGHSGFSWVGMCVQTSETSPLI